MKSQILPLGIKDRSKTELPALVALSAIGQPWFCDDHRCDLMSLAMIAQLMSPPESPTHALSNTLIDLLGPDELDSIQLHDIVIPLTSWFQRQDNGRVQHAIDLLLGNHAGAKRHG